MEEKTTPAVQPASPASVLIISDIHGCFRTFKKLYDEVTSRFPGEPVLIAGDLPDRGPRTRELIQFMIDNQIPCLQGNHDDMMQDPLQAELWFANGGLQAFQTYCTCEDGIVYKGFDAYMNPEHKCEGTAVLQQHREFLQGLPYWFEFPELKHANGRHLIVTHAPLRHGKLENQLAHRGWDGLTFVWNRHTPPRGNTENWFNIHGHTPRRGAVEITDWYANLDLGCAYTDRSAGYGKLSCLRFPSMEVFVQPNIEDPDELT